MVKVNKTIKIFNKSKEGIKFVIHKMKGVKPAFMSWEEFNKTFEFDKEDKTLAHLKPEWEKKYEEVEDILSMIMVHILSANAHEKGDASKFITEIGCIGASIKRLAELLECTEAEAMKLIIQRKEAFINASLNMGASFGKCHNRMMNTDQIKKSEENEKRIKEKVEEKSEKKSDPYSCSIGDMINAKNK